jgi:hypothetical protein
MGEREPHIPIRHVAQERIDALTPERREVFEAATTVYSVAATRARSPLARRLGQALAESFTADMGNFLADVQGVPKENPENQ